MFLLFHVEPVFFQKKTFNYFRLFLFYEDNNFEISILYIYIYTNNELAYCVW